VFRDRIPGDDSAARPRKKAAIAGGMEVKRTEKDARLSVGLPRTFA